MPGDSGNDLSLALGILTAWRDRASLGDDQIVDLFKAAAVDAGGWHFLVVALVDLAAGLLNGFDKATGDLLADPARMSRAFVACAKQEPLTSAAVGLDAAAVLDRIGRHLASLPT